MRSPLAASVTFGIRIRIRRAAATRSDRTRDGAANTSADRIGEAANTSSDIIAHRGRPVTHSVYALPRSSNDCARSTYSALSGGAHVIRTYEVNGTTRISARRPIASYSASKPSLLAETASIESTTCGAFDAASQAGITTDRTAGKINRTSYSYAGHAVGGTVNSSGKAALLAQKRTSDIAKPADRTATRGGSVVRTAERPVHGASDITKQLGLRGHRHNAGHSECSNHLDGRHVILLYEVEVPLRSWLENDTTFRLHPAGPKNYLSPTTLGAISQSEQITPRPTRPWPFTVSRASPAALPKAATRALTKGVAKLVPRTDV